VEGQRRKERGEWKERGGKIEGRKESRLDKTVAERQ
jgi:hypothetical protein